MSSSNDHSNSAAAAQANNNSSSNNNNKNKKNKPPNSNEAGHYVVTAHRPGGVIVSTRCSFLGPDSVDVVIAKSRRLEVRQLSRSSPSASASPNNSSMEIDQQQQQQQQSPTFSLVLSAPINGRIISLIPFRHPSSQTDYIFFLTENKRYAVISYSPSSSSSSSAGGAAAAAMGTTTSGSGSGGGNNVHNLITHASGDLSDYGLAIRGNEPEHGPIATIEPSHKCIVLHLYEGYVTVLPIHLPYRYKPQQQLLQLQQQQQKFGMRGGTGEAHGLDFMGPAFHCRVEERDIFCMEFLQLSDARVGNSSNNNNNKTTKCMPQLALLHQDSRGLQHVIAHSLDLKQKQLIAHGVQNNNSSSSSSSSSKTASKSSSKGTTSSSTTSTAAGGLSMSRSSSGGGRAAQSLHPPPLHQRLKKSRVEGGSGIIISTPPPNPNANANNKSSGSSYDILGDSSSVNPTSTSATTSPTTKMGGVVILGHRKITYHNTAENITKVLPISPCLFESYVEVRSSSSSASSFSNDGEAKLSANDNHDSTLRYLLGDDLGRIHILALLRNEHGNVTDLHMDTLGEANVSTCLVYLDHGLLFLGSHYTDSQLIQILDQPVEVTSTSMVSFENESYDYGHGFHDDILLHGKKLTYLSVIDEYVNLGPIVDFDLVPTTHSAVEGEANHSSALQKRQSMAITASGAGKDGSLRLVSNGIGMTEHAAVELAGIKGMWNVRKSFNDMDDAFLIQSYVGETRILGVAVDVEGEESDMDDVEDSSSVGATLEEVEIPGIDAGSSTLFAGNIASHSCNSSSSLIIQITESEVRVVDLEAGAVKSTWSPSSVSAQTGSSENPLITVAAANQSGQIVLALGGGILIYLRVMFADDLKVDFLGQAKLDQEISCLNLNPFDSDYLDSKGTDDDSAMELDEETNNQKRNRVLISAIVAVGVWDDFHVRILSLNGAEALKEISRVNIAPDVNSYKGSENYLRQHLIARSLCFVTLKSTANGAAAKGSDASSLDNRVNMLLIGLGDGGLVSFVVNTETENNDGPPCTIHSRKEVSLGTRAINLIPFHNHTTDKGTCVLATGDRPTVIYLASGGGSNKIPKLCYSNINLETDSEEVDDEENLSRARFERLVVNVATPFHSSVLFSTSNALDKNYSLCLSNESTLRLGIIDDIQKLHVTTHKLGMAPRRVTYHESGRVVCVGCIDDGSGNSDPIARNNANNKGNCIRFFDDTTFEEFNRLDLEPFEMILSMMSVQLKVNKDDVNIQMEGDAAPRKNGPNSEPDEETYRSFLVVGTAFSYPDEDEPSKGRILLIHCDIRGGIVPTSQSSPSRNADIVTEVQVSGGVYSICPFYNGTILATINAKTHLCKLSGGGPGSDGNFDLKIDNAGHRGHILSLIVKSLAGAESNTLSKKEEQIAIVGDLARSISVVKFYPEYGTLEEVARDFNQNWLTAIEMLSQDVYLGGENFHNLFVLRRNPDADSEEVRSRLDTIGLFNLGEMVNKFIRGSLVIPNNSSNASSSDAVNHSSSSNGGDSLKSQSGKSVMNIGSQTLYGTIDGTIGSIIGLDTQTATFLSSLERAMTLIITPVGNLKHNEFRAFRGQRCQQGSRGFIDGDLIESFVDLDRKTMELVVKEMKAEGKWKFKSDESLSRESIGNNGDEEMKEASYGEKASGLNVSDVITMVEEISMLH